jgi:hypothetical protein
VATDFSQYEAFSPANSSGADCPPHASDQKGAHAAAGVQEKSRTDDQPSTSHDLPEISAPDDFPGARRVDPAV